MIYDLPFPVFFNLGAQIYNYQLKIQVLFSIILWLKNENKLPNFRAYVEDTTIEIFLLLRRFKL